MAKLQDVTKRAREQHALVFEGLMAQLGSLKTTYAIVMQERCWVEVVHTARVGDIHGSVVLAAFVEDRDYSASDFSSKGAAYPLERLRLGDNPGELDFVADIEAEEVLEKLRLCHTC